MISSIRFTPVLNVVLGASPHEADVAIVSIDRDGNPGRLNQYVLKEFGYSINDLPESEMLRYGFGTVNNRGKKPIIFVVTVGEDEVSSSLEDNLFSALAEFRGWFRNKRLWLPLLGTGDGGLSLRNSFDITLKVLEKFEKAYPTETDIQIAFPDDEEGHQLFNALSALEIPLDPARDAEKFLMALNCNFFVVGSIWGGEDQMPRFLADGIWEKGYEDESYAGIINQIRVNDILILKSTWANNEGKNYLRVKAIGIVTALFNDGASVEVDWKIKGLSLDVLGLGYYRTTISPMDFTDAVKVFTQIDWELWRNLLPAEKLPEVNPNKIAGILSDSDRGPDYLNFKKDVTAFARVIAAKSFEPPLAIALFGKWGSGKSFFMRMLKEQVRDLPRNESTGYYCEGIAQIHFNAWSYMDANLWASIVSRIFEGLHEYISEHSKSDLAKKEIESQLGNQLNIAKEEIQILENKKNAVQQQIDQLEQKRNAIKIEIAAKIKRIEKETTWEVIKNIDTQFKVKEKIVNILQANDSYVKTENELKKIVPEKYWNDPVQAYRQASSAYTFLREFFRTGKYVQNLFWLTLIIVIILLIPPILELFIKKINDTNFLIPQAALSFLVMLGAGWRKAEATYKKLQPLVASFWNIKNDYEKQVNEALAKFEQEEKALKLEIEKSKDEMRLLNEQIHKAEVVKSDLEFKIKNALATEALYSFIERRSQSEDYKKHLGIISVIRKDFEILNGLFTDHNREVVSAEQAEKFKKQFNKPLERIVLYIDDLDRCPEDNVVQVLEAVNLLMAFPLFIVIVGVDPRWVKNALIKKYSLQFTGKLNGLDQNETGIELIEPSNYLEKIFQIPFHLKVSENDDVKDMIKNLAEIKPKLNEIESVGETARGEEGTKGNKSDKDSANGAQTTDKPVQPVTNSTSNLPRKSTDPLALAITATEINLMQDISEIIGNNPRAIKRFVNIYRVIKAHEEFSYNERLETEELMSIFFLIALPLGKYKSLLVSFVRFMNEPASDLEPFEAFFGSLVKVDSRTDEFRNLMNATLAGKESYSKLRKHALHNFARHYTFIRRFSFGPM